MTSRSVPLACAFALSLAVLAACKSHAVCVNCLPARTLTDGGIGLDAGGAGATRVDGSIVTCIPTGDDEICNRIDDDCDGEVDEDFDLGSDPRHCGRCDHPCDAQNTDALCIAGSCHALGCQPGFADLDGDPGCEYRCPVFPAQDEDCNDVDDDCDGTIDDHLVAPQSTFCRHGAGTPCHDVGLVCDTRAGRKTWYCDYPPGVEFDPIIPNGIASEETLCDGADNDCDGLVDELWPELGEACDDGNVGACRDGGEVRCHSVDTWRTYCDLTALPDAIAGAGPLVTEVCNGVDDDCDGTVDNADVNDPTRVRDAMAHVTHSGFDYWIYRYEASRPDSTGSSQGQQTTRACSKSGSLPWAHVSYTTASAACAAAGRRLCTAAEWQAACEGPSATSYPYGASYEPDRCNGADHDVVPGGDIDNTSVVSGSLSACARGGAYDLSGNVREWTADPQGTTGAPDHTPIYVTRGGSYLSPELGLTCQTTLSQASEDSQLPTVGFRCCSDTGP